MCREQVAPFLEHCLDNIPWYQYRIVGFTSTFQQHIASLALARRLKLLFPHLFIIFGGANCEESMGLSLFYNFEFVDAICSGEGDQVFPELVQRLLNKQSINGLRGILRRSSETNDIGKLNSFVEYTTMADSIRDMDSLPYPNYDDFFAEAVKNPIDGEPPLVLPFESSRGCWWGEKSHCTFCGLNGMTMSFRHKSANRTLEEIQWLLNRYGEYTRSLTAVDNIMPYEFLRTFLPMLRELDIELSLFYETKSNLRKDQVKLYSDAGLRTIQPGIETLSTEILKLMRKGVTQLQNIELLKWCSFFAVKPFWNYLIGFPGERPEHYSGQVDLINALLHLPPPYPYGIRHVRFDRFSPYFTHAEALGVSDLRPYPAYGYVYSGLLDEDSLHNIAYYFVGDFDGKDLVETYTKPLQQAINYWIANYEESALFSVDIGESLYVCDCRKPSDETVIVLRGPQRHLYEACESITGERTLIKVLQQYIVNADKSTLESILEPLLERKLLIQEDSKYLSLAIPLADNYVPPQSVTKRFVAMLEKRISGD